VPADAKGETASLEAPEVERAQSRPGSVVANRFEIEALLGQGGMGSVYRVFDRELHRVVALKLIRLSGKESREQREHREARFFHEARAMARLDHPGCVQIHDFGITEGSSYIVMELVTGLPLVEVIRSGITPGRAALLLHQVAGALQRVHDAGIVHRDVKPHNILVTSSGAKLTDFGVAHLDATFTRITKEGSGAIGTPAYMPPEQTGSEKVDARSDVYSLGATLYECLAKRPPFFPGHGGDLIRAIRGTRPVPPRRLAPGVPRDLEAIALRCLEKRPDRRYSSARDVEDELGRFLAGEPVRARPRGFLERLWRGSR
jgi:serine/threonine protein kinase